MTGLEFLQQNGFQVKSFSHHMTLSKKHPSIVIGPEREFRTIGEFFAELMSTVRSECALDDGEEIFHAVTRMISTVKLEIRGYDTILYFPKEIWIDSPLNELA